MTLSLFLIKLLNKLKIINYFNLSETILLNNQKFKIPIIGGLGLSNLYMSEPWMVDLLKIITPIANDKFIDVGVNVGQTLIKLKSVNQNIDYVGFEPNPSCVNYVNELVKQNSFKNITLIPVGISEKNEIGELVFFYASKADSSASIIENFRPNQAIHRKEYIPIFDVQTIKKTTHLENLSIIKIDVEGAELEVIRGFKEDIKNCHPILMVEILPSYNIENIVRINRQQEIESILKEFNYKMYSVIKENEKFIDFKEIETFEIHGDLNACEYVFVPDTKVEAFKTSIENFKNL